MRDGQSTGSNQANQANDLAAATAKVGEHPAPSRKHKLQVARRCCLLPERKCQGMSGTSSANNRLQRVNTPWDCGFYSQAERASTFAAYAAKMRQHTELLQQHNQFAAWPCSILPDKKRQLLSQQNPLHKVRNLQDYSNSIAIRRPPLRPMQPKSESTHCFSGSTNRTLLGFIA